MSHLRKVLADYLSMRRALGYKMDQVERRLRQFIAFAEDNGETHVRTVTALAWATLPPGADPIWTHARLADVRIFARHLHTLDDVSEVPPDDLLPARRRRTTPYLYTLQEVADLMRAITEPCSIDFMVVSSYGGANTTSTGLVKIVKDLDQDLSGKDVLIVEDILDTGVTLSHLVPMLKLRRPNSVRLCTILSKPSRRKVDIEPDYCGFEVPDEFVVGYGLDYDEKYRNLPYVGVLKPEVYSK